MQYLHQSHYGHIGEGHTAKPLMAMEGGKIYDMKGGHADTTKPIFVVRDNRAYATEHHAGGASPHAIFEIRGDKIHTTEHHPAHDPEKHMYEIKGMMT